MCSDCMTIRLSDQSKQDSFKDSAVMKKNISKHKIKRGGKRRDSVSKYRDLN